MPRRRDTVEVVGAALCAHAASHGHRRIAARLELLASTVRNWIRGFGRQADQLRSIATLRYYELDANASPIIPAGSPAADTVEALSRAARAAILRFGAFDHPWAVINIVPAGRLLTSEPSPVRPI